MSPQQGSNLRKKDTAAVRVPNLFGLSASVSIHQVTVTVWVVLEKCVAVLLTPVHVRVLVLVAMNGGGLGEHMMHGKKIKVKEVGRSQTS